MRLGGSANQKRSARVVKQGDVHRCALRWRGQRSPLPDRGLAECKRLVLGLGLGLELGLELSLELGLELRLQLGLGL
jgi:hypothetical protein